MFEASSRPLCSTTLTSGFSASMKMRADVGLRHPDPFGVVDHLALQVGGVDDVVVDEADGPDPGRGQVERGRRAEPAGAEQQDLRVQQLELAVDPDLGQQGVARVAVALLRGHPGGGDDRQPLLLPERGSRPPSRRRSRSRAPAAARRRSPSGCRSGSRGSCGPTCRARRRRSRRRAAPAATSLPPSRWASWYSCGSRVSIRTTSPPSISSLASKGSISSIVNLLGAAQWP